MIKSIYGTGASQGDVGVVWSNLSRVLVDDDSFATCKVNGSYNSLQLPNQLTITGYSMDLSEYSGINYFQIEYGLHVIDDYNNGISQTPAPDIRVVFEDGTSITYENDDYLSDNYDSKLWVSTADLVDKGITPNMIKEGFSLEFNFKDTHYLGINYKDTCTVCFDYAKVNVHVGDYGLCTVTGGLYDTNNDSISSVVVGEEFYLRINVSDLYVDSNMINISKSSSVISATKSTAIISNQGKVDMMEWVYNPVRTTDSTTTAEAWIPLKCISEGSFWIKLYINNNLSPALTLSFSSGFGDNVLNYGFNSSILVDEVSYFDIYFTTPETLTNDTDYILDLDTDNVIINESSISYDIYGKYISSGTPTNNPTYGYVYDQTPDDNIYGVANSTDFTLYPQDDFRYFYHIVHIRVPFTPTSDDSSITATIMRSDGEVYTTGVIDLPVNEGGVVSNTLNLIPAVIGGLRRSITNSFFEGEEAELSFSFNKCMFKWDKPLEGIMINKPVAYIGAVLLNRGHKADVTNTTTNSLVEETYQNRKYMGKKGDWDEDITMTLRIPWQDCVTIQGHVRMDTPIPIDTTPEMPDGDPLIHRGWAEIYSTGPIRKINDSLYQIEPKVKYLTHELLGRFTIIQSNERLSPVVPQYYLTTSHEYFEDLREIMSMSNYLDFTNMNIGLEKYKGVYEVSANNSYEFLTKKVVSPVSRYSFRWRNILPMLGSKAHDENRWMTAVRVLDNETKNLLLEYLYYDFEHMNNNELLNECKVKVTHLNELGDYDVTTYQRMNLDFDNVNAELYEDKINTYIDFGDWDETSTIEWTKRDNNFYVTLRDVNGYPLGNKVIDVLVLDYDEDSTPIVTAPSTGKANWESNLPNGTYTVQFKFTGDDEYNETYHNLILLMDMDVTTATLFSTSSNQVFVDKNHQFVTQLLTTGNESLYHLGYTDEKITFKVKEDKKGSTWSHPYYKTLDEDGYARLNIRLTTGNYVMKMEYEGREEPDGGVIGGCSDTVKFKVTIGKGAKTKLTAYNKTYDVGTEGAYYGTYLKNATTGKVLTGKKIKFSLYNTRWTEEKTYERTTNSNGFCKLPIHLNTGLYYVDTIFEGDNDYLPCIVSRTLLMKGRDGKLVCELSADNLEITDCYVHELAAYLKDTDGNPLVNYPIKYHITGKSNGELVNDYYKYTDVNGKAELNINLGTGTYLATISSTGAGKYNETSLVRTITVKRPTGRVKTDCDITPSNLILGQDEDTDTANEKLSFLFYKADDTHKDGISSLSAGISIYDTAKLIDGEDTAFVQGFYNCNSDLDGVMEVTPHLDEGLYTVRLQQYCMNINGVNYDYLNKEWIITVKSNTRLGTIIETYNEKDETGTSVLTTKKSGDPLRIRLLDEDGNALGNKEVTYTFTSDSGRVSSYKRITNDKGYASYGLQLGTDATVVISFVGDVGYEPSTSDTVSVVVTDEDLTDAKLNIIFAKELGKESDNPMITYKMSGEILPIWLKWSSKNYYLAHQRLKIVFVDSSNVTDVYYRYTDKDGYIGMPVVISNAGFCKVYIYLVRDDGNEFRLDLYTVLNNGSVNKLSNEGAYILVGDNEGGASKPEYEESNKINTSVEITGYVDGVTPKRNDVDNIPYYLRATVHSLNSTGEESSVIHNKEVVFELTEINKYTEKYIRYTDKDGVATLEVLTHSASEYPVIVTVVEDSDYYSSSDGTTLIISDEVEDEALNPTIDDSNIPYAVGGLDELETPDPDTYNGLIYGSTLDLVFTNNNVDIHDYGLCQDTSLMSGKVNITSLWLPEDTDYLVEFTTYYNDIIDNSVQYLYGTLQVEMVEDKSISEYQGLYSNLICSPAPLHEYKLLFTREADDGTIWYYDASSSVATKLYKLSPYYNYKAGVNLETKSGVSLFDLTTGVSPYVINNGLVKVEFHVRSGFIRLYRYEYTVIDDEDNNQYINESKWVPVRYLKLDGDDFSIELKHYTLDKISLDFGGITFTVWRGHPWVEVKHNGKDLSIINHVNRVYCEVNTNSRHLDLVDEVSVGTNGEFYTTNGLNLFPNSLKVSEDIKLDYFLGVMGAISNPYENGYKRGLQVTNNKKASWIGCLFPTHDGYLFDKPSSDTFTLLINRFKTNMSGDVKVTVQGQKEDGTAVSLSNAESVISSEEFLHNGELNTGLRFTFQVTDESIKYIQFVVSMDSESKSSDDYFIMNELMLYNDSPAYDTNGKLVGTSNYDYEADTHNYYLDNTMVYLEDTYYTKLYNSYDDYGLCILRPNKKSIYLNKLPSDKVTVLIPYLKNAKTYDKPECVCIEYLYAKEQESKIYYEDS